MKNLLLTLCLIAGFAAPTFSEAGCGCGKHHNHHHSHDHHHHKG